MDEITEVMLQQIKDINERDEGQILAELAGETVDEYIYEIMDKKKGRTVKLSWVGTREVARAKGNIALSDPIIEDQDGYVRIVVKATDLRRNFSVFGGCHQPKKQKVKLFDEKQEFAGYREEDDPHYFPKALSKAQRNVIQSVIPTSFMAKMIDTFLLKSGQKPLKQLPKPKETKPRINENAPLPLPEDLKTLHDLEVASYNRWHIQPADVYKQLGYSNKSDVIEKPTDLFLKLKEIYEPVER